MEGKNDGGFGLVEVVVSMLMLAVLAIAFLPLLIQGLKQSASNATIATATQRVDGDLDVARSVAETAGCGAINASPTSETDARGVAFTVRRTVGTCPASFPGTVKYTVKVTRNDGDADVTNDKVLAAATTVIYVTR